MTPKEKLLLHETQAKLDKTNEEINQKLHPTRLRAKLLLRKTQPK